MIAMFHNAVNQAHNGGWWLNKFVPKALFDKHAIADLQTVSRTIGRRGYVIMQARAQESGASVDVDPWVRRRDHVWYRRVRPQINVRRVTFGEVGDHGIAHVQVRLGRGGAYPSFNVTLSEETARELDFLIQRFPTRRSFSGSMARYTSIPFNKIPTWIRSAAPITDAFITDCISGKEIKDHGKGTAPKEQDAIDHDPDNEQYECPDCN